MITFSKLTVLLLICNVRVLLDDASLAEILDPCLGKMLVDWNTNRRDPEGIYACRRSLFAYSSISLHLSEACLTSSRCALNSSSASEFFLPVCV